MVAKVNRWAAFIAFSAILIGAVAAVTTIWLPPGGSRGLALQIFWSAVTLFAAASVALCTVKYFYANREQLHQRN